MGEEHNITLSSNEKLARLRLIRSAGIGPVIFNKLIETHGSAIDALSSLQESKHAESLADQDAIYLEYEKTIQKGITLLFLGDHLYPARLAAIADAPPVLAALGDIQLLQKTAIAVVGARNASASGLKFTKKICADLSAKGIAIVSGLARGIDTEAHKASLPYATIACLAGGLDNIYPPENAALFHNISEQGLLVSEMPLGTKPQAKHFPRRNRIISGLSEGILVIEAAKKSGSLITARFAADQGRDVFAVPGSPLDPRSQGTNQLIKDGAILTQCAEDILTELSTMPLLRTTLHTAPSSKAETQQTTLTIPTVPTPSKQADLLAYLSPNPIHIDEVVRLSGAPTNYILGTFMTLELEGKIIRHSGNRFSRISSKN